MLLPINHEWTWWQAKLVSRPHNPTWFVQFLYGEHVYLYLRTISNLYTFRIPTDRSGLLHAETRRIESLVSCNGNLQHAPLLLFNSFSLIASVVLPLFSALVLALSCNHHLSAGQNKCVHPCPREALHHLHPMSFPTRSSHSLSSVALSAVQCRARGPFQTIDPGRHFYSCDSHGVSSSSTVQSIGCTLSD